MSSWCHGVLRVLQAAASGSTTMADHGSLWAADTGGCAALSAGASEPPAATAAA